MKFLVFHNAVDDSYVNTAENFKGAFASTQTVDVYFASALGSTTYDKIVLACTDGEEDRVVEQLADAMTRNSSRIIIADDVNSVYSCQDILSVTSIALAAKGNVEHPAIVTAVNRQMLASESGATILVNHAAKVITMPTVANGLQAGMHFTVVPLIDPEAGFTVVCAEGIYGAIQVTSATQAEGLAAEQSVLRAACLAAPGNFDNFDLLHSAAALGGVAGESFKFTYDGGAWLLGNTFISSDHADPASIAIINAG